MKVDNSIKLELINPAKALQTFSEIRFRSVAFQQREFIDNRIEEVRSIFRNSCTRWISLDIQTKSCFCVNEKILQEIDHFVFNSDIQGSIFILAQEKGIDCISFSLRLGSSISRLENSIRSVSGRFTVESSISQEFIRIENR